MAVTRPDGVGELAGKMHQAAAALTRAEAKLTDAERADDEARAGRVQAGDAAETRQSLGLLQQRASVVEEIGRLAVERDAAGAQLAARQTALDAAQRVLDEAAQHVHAAQAAGLAADLRTQLTVGEDCPVCDRRVDALPATLDALDLAPARAAELDARAAVKAADRSVREADRLATHLAAQLAGSHRTLEDLERSLADAHPGADLASLASFLADRLGGIAAAEGRASETDAALKVARRERGEAQARVTELRASYDAGWRQFRVKRAGLLAWGCPTDEPADLVEAWGVLADWVGQEVGRVDNDTLPALAARSEETAEALGAATDLARLGRERRREAEAAATQAARVDTSASDSVARAEARSLALGTLPTEQADADAVADALERLSAAEATGKEARERLADPQVAGRHGLGPLPSAGREREPGDGIRLHDVRWGATGVGGPSMHWTAPNGCTRTSTLRPGARAPSSSRVKRTAVASVVRSTASGSKSHAVSADSPAAGSVRRGRHGADATRED